MIEEKWYRIAEENGISRSHLRTRFKRWGDIEKSATEPIIYQPRVLTDAEIELVRKNRINLATVYWRIHKGWDREVALNKKVGWRFIHS